MSKRNRLKRHYRQNPYDHLILQEAFSKGMDARKTGKKRSPNPYDDRVDSILNWQWDAGWIAMDRHIWRNFDHKQNLINFI